MKIENPQINRPQLTLEAAQIKSNPKGSEQLLKVGEQITVRVSNHNSAAQLYTLKNNNLQLQVKSGLSFEIGQKLQLLVEKNNPTLQLKISSPTTTQHAIQQALRGAISKQLPIDQALNTLFKQSGELLLSRTNLLPESISKLLQKIQNTLPDARSVSTPEGLKKSLQNSGIFLENNLAKELISGVKNSSAANQDLKAQLLKLAFLIKENNHHQLNKELISPESLKGSTNRLITPMALWDLLFKKESTLTTRKNSQGINKNTPEFQQQINLLKNLADSSDGAIAKQQLNQLNNLTTQDETKPYWNIEIPVINDKNVSLLKMRIHKDDSNNSNNHEPSWQITLEFPLPQLGSLRVNVHLQGKKLTTHLWSENSKQITPFLGQLKERLEKHGLEVTKINCHHGLPPQPKHIQHKPVSGLLDIEV